MDFFTPKSLDVFKPISKNAGFFNARQKFYPTPDGDRRLVEVCVFSEPVYNPNGLEQISVKRKKSGGFSSDEQEQEIANSCSDSSIRRARRRLYDLVSCNPECNMMITLTLNGDDFPRDDWSKIIPKVNNWLDNMVRRHGLKYVLVPEYHKDGSNIHFHGFVNENSLSLVRAINPKTGKPLLQKGRAVYNVANWKYGFTTAVRVGKSDKDRAHSARYVLKYITKGQEKIGGRYYLHGGELREPLYEYFNTDFEHLSVSGAEWSEFTISDTLACKIRTINVS